MKKDIVIIGAGPGGMEAAIHLGQSGLDVALIDPRLGSPEGPQGILTVAKRSSIFGKGDCGQPSMEKDWVKHSEGPLNNMMIAGRRTIGKLNSGETLGHTFTRKQFWELMLDAARSTSAEAIQDEVIEAEQDDKGVTVKLKNGDPIKAKGVIYAAGVRNGSRIARQLGLGTPPVVHGIFGDIQFDGDDWNSPELCFLFNLELVNHGYFWAAYGRKSNIISIGILDNKPPDEKLIQRFANTGIIPEIKNKVPSDIKLETGTLGAVSHKKSSGWPVKSHARRVLGIGEAIGAISTYVYEGVFHARYLGMMAARRFIQISKTNAWHDLQQYQAFDDDWKRLDDYLMHMARMQHHAMYHGIKNGQIALEAYLKAFNKEKGVAVENMVTQYLEFSNMRRYELPLFGAILNHVPFLDKLGVTSAMLAARMQK